MRTNDTFPRSPTRAVLLAPVVFGVLTLATLRGSDPAWEASLHGPDTFWGAETNGLRVALHMEPAPSLGTTGVLCTPVLKSSRSNVLWLYLPPLESRYKLTLTDADGTPVTRTAKGAELGKVLTKPFALTTGVNYSAGYAGVPPLHHQSELLGASEFALQDYFVLTRPGKYRLIFGMGVIWFPPGWKGSRKSASVPVVWLPPAYVDFEIKTEGQNR